MDTTFIILSCFPNGSLFFLINYRTRTVDQSWNSSIYILFLQSMRTNTNAPTIICWLPWFIPLVVVGPTMLNFTWEASHLSPVTCHLSPPCNKKTLTNNFCYDILWESFPSLPPPTNCKTALLCCIHQSPSCRLSWVSLHTIGTLNQEHGRKAPCIWIPYPIMARHRW